MAGWGVECAGGGSTSVAAGGCGTKQRLAAFKP